MRSAICFTSALVAPWLWGGCTGAGVGPTSIEPTVLGERDTLYGWGSERMGATDPLPEDFDRQLTSVAQELGAFARPEYVADPNPEDGMKTKAAVAVAAGKPLEVTEVDVRAAPTVVPRPPLSTG